MEAQGFESKVRKLGDDGEAETNGESNDTSITGLSKFLFFHHSF